MTDQKNRGQQKNEYDRIISLLAENRRAEETKKDDRRYNALIDALTGLMAQEKNNPPFIKKITDAFGHDLRGLFGPGHLADILNRRKLSTVLIDGTFNVDRPLTYILNHILRYETISSALQGVYQALTDPEPPSPGGAAGEILITGMLKLTALQNPSQQYHTLLHALEMKEDVKKAMKKIYPDPQSEFFIELVTNMAAYHDIIQMKGQYINEDESARAFCADFAGYYRHYFGIMPADLLVAAQKVIIEGTLLSMSFESPAPLHTTLHAILADIDTGSLFCLTGRENPGAKQWEEATALMTHMDVNRATIGTQPSIPAQWSAKIHGIIAEHVEGGDDIFQIFQVLVGQSLRMMADGPCKNRSFKDPLRDFYAAIDLARRAGTPGLSSTESHRFQRALEQHIEDHLPRFIQGIQFNTQIKFSQGMDSRYAAVTMGLLGRRVASKALMGMMSTHENIWGIHGKLCKSLQESIDRCIRDNDTASLVNIYAGLIFSAAHQYGLELLCEDSLLLRAIYREQYHIDLPENIDNRQSRIYAMTHLSVSMDADLRALIAHFHKACLRHSGEEKTLRIRLDRHISEKMAFFSPHAVVSPALSDEPDPRH